MNKKKPCINININVVCINLEIYMINQVIHTIHVPVGTLLNAYTTHVKYG